MMAAPMGGSKGRDVRQRFPDDRDLVRALNAWTEPTIPPTPATRDIRQGRDRQTLQVIGELWEKWKHQLEERHGDFQNSRVMTAVRRAYRAEIVIALEFHGYAPTRTDALWTAAYLLRQYGRPITDRTLQNAVRDQQHPPGRPDDVLPLLNDWPLSIKAEVFGFLPEWSTLLHVCSGRLPIPLRPEPRPRGPDGHSRNRKRRISES